MQTLLLVLTIILLAVIGLLLFLLYRRTNSQSFVDQLTPQLQQLYTESLEKLITSVQDQAKKAIQADKALIKQDLEVKQKEFKELVEHTLQELRSAQKERLSLKQLLAEHRLISEKLQVETQALKQVLSNNQLRGQFGEKRAEELLQLSGFVIGKHYQKQSAQQHGRPDFTLFLPDGTKINIDVKFPYAKLQSALETENQTQRQRFLKEFEADVKQRIKEVSGREYINPEEKTVDFAILFIPNEMIFSYIYDHMNPVWHEALKKRVILAGPFSFTAILQMVSQAYENFKYQQNLREIVDYIRKFEQEFQKYSQEFSKLGKYIEQLDKKFHEVDSTRTRQLLRIVDKIKLSDTTNNLPKLNG